MKRSLWLLALMLWVRTAEGHGIDQAAAEVLMDDSMMTVSLTLPTTLVGFADDDRNGEIDPAEARRHEAALVAALQGGLEVNAGADRESFSLSVLEPLPAALDFTPASGVLRRTHTTLLLTYRWRAPAGTVTINYNMFVSGFPNASCLVSLHRGTTSQTTILTPSSRQLLVLPAPPLPSR